MVGGPSKDFWLKTGTKLKRAGGRVGLGVPVRVGLVWPSLVSSAVDAPLPLLHVDALEWALRQSEKRFSSS